jgi:hypothetical protein
MSLNVRILADHRITALEMGAKATVRSPTSNLTFSAFHLVLTPILGPRRERKDATATRNFTQVCSNPTSSSLFGIERSRTQKRHFAG